MKIIYISLLSLSLLLIAQDASAQSGCSLSINNAPVIRGVTLGMSSQQLRAQYTVDVDLVGGDHGKVGVKSFMLSNMDAPRKLQGIESISGDFYDDRIYSLQVIYSGYSEWKDAKDFVVNDLSELGLPDAWNLDGDRGDMDCGGFYISFTVSNRTKVFLDMSNKSIWDEVTKKRKELKADFKP